MYLKIKPQHWRSSSTCTLACWADYHVSVGLQKCYRVQEVWNRAIFADHYEFGEQVILGMLRTDIVHLNFYDYLGLVSFLMKCLLNKWKGLLGLFGRKIV